LRIFSYIQAAKEVDLPRFKASRRWCLTFKRNHRIRSRKITKFVTRAQIAKADDISQKARDFVKDVREAMLTVGTKHTYNCDQSGFNKELHSGRTLQVQGVKSVDRVVQSVHSTTHSYTIQPTMNADGEFLSPLLLVLQEPGGEFGPNVQRTMFKV